MSESDCAWSASVALSAMVHDYVGKEDLATTTNADRLMAVVASTPVATRRTSGSEGHSTVLRGEHTCAVEAGNSAELHTPIRGDCRHSWAAVRH